MVATILAMAIGLPQNQKLNWTGPRIYEVGGRTGVHQFKVRFEQANFKARGREFLWTVDLDAKQLYSPAFGPRNRHRPIYGWRARSREEIIGTPAERMEERDTEIVSLMVMVNGRMWAVARRLYDDLHNPDFGDEYVKAKLNSEGTTLTVRMEGADAAAGYIAVWTFRKNGKHSRRIEDP